MAEIVLSTLLGVMFQRLASPDLLSFVLGEGVGEKMDKCSKMLRRIEPVLDDADEKQHTHRAVKCWLDKFKDLAYDMDDILDEIVTEALQRKLTTENQAITSKVRDLIPACCTGFSPSAVKVNMRLGSRLDEIAARFNEILNEKYELRLSENVDRRSHRTRETLWPTSIVTEARVYGREKDKEAVLELLLGEKCSDAQLSVISILGMVGIGKTTLAQLIYNDEKVKRFFDVKAWACVSIDFDVVRVTKAILQSFTRENCDGKDLNWLQGKLKENLEGKKFLVILDDLWNENYQDWTILCAPFEAGALGSMIIITTRNENVARKTCTIPAYHLKELSYDDCLSIFANNALGTSDFSTHPNLRDIGEGIVRRCKGSPLQAKVFGGILHNEVGCDIWEKVLKANIWEIHEVDREILSSLMLSYNYLPSHLKRCFEYCSILPKDYAFTEEEVVLLWMAEGLIQPGEETQQMEELGAEYFRNLQLRSFFQHSFKDESRFLMYDLFNDLAEWVAGDICFKMEGRVGVNNERNPSRKVRHLSYLGGQYDGIQKFEVFSDLTCLQTFLPLMFPNLVGCYLTSNVSLELLPKLLSIRVLSLSGYCIYELPKSIGNMKHLRFLNLSLTKIRSLPESVATLYNLQTLILERCYYLKKLPSKFGNLVNLRHLNILGANALEEMPPRIGKLTSLQSLSNLIVGKGSCSSVKELGPLLHLRKTLCISRLENVTNCEDARDAMLIEKHNLYGLSLEWSDNLDESHDITSELEVLNMLQPHAGLKELTIKHYGSAKLPSWLSVPKFFNMVLLKIESCAKCTSLPAVGILPSLKDLFIKGMADVKNIGCEFYGEGCSQPFKSLETLLFENMQEWESWNPCGEFPKLRELSIRTCPKLLGKLPNHLPSLENVVIDRCRQLVVSISSFPESCKVEIKNSKGVVCGSKVDFSSLCFRSLSTISEFTCQIEGFIMEGLTNVKDLTIAHCEELTNLWSNDVGLLQHLPCLGVLKIRDCSKLVSLVAKDVEVPSKLREIKIENCKVLESLPNAMMYNSTHLQEICIGYCPSLTHFAIGQLPPILKRLKIWSCKNMLILVDDINSCGSNISLLEYLDISSCPSLKSLTSSGELPATLKDLKIWDCEKLESIAKSFHHNSSLELIDIWSCENLKSLPMGMHNLNHLDQIYIWGCPNLVSFLDGGFLPANLRELTIFKCKKMQALPNCIHNVTSLQRLKIQGCLGIVAFPTNLTFLSIHDMAFNEPFFELELHKLTSLKQLEIDGGSSHLVSLSGMIMPPSLTSLKIKHFPILKYLSSKDFQFLTSLEELWIERCTNLTSFPEDGLPPSLLQLCIFYCPLLKELCKKDQGQEWFKIARIPFVKIDGRFIYEPEEENH